MTPMKRKPKMSANRYPRALAIVAILAVLLAAVITAHDEHGSPLTALPGATAQPAPTGPTGGSGGGSGGPPFPLQPPDMPSAPGGYNSGSYPAPDQNNGVSIYNSDAPQSPGSRGSSQQGENYQQQLQPANGTQPPNYDAPLQTQPAPPRAPTAPQQAPTQQQQQPAKQQDHSAQPTDQRETQCEQIARAMGIAESVFNVAGAGGSRSGGRVQPGRDAPGQGTWCACTNTPNGPRSGPNVESVDQHNPYNVLDGSRYQVNSCTSANYSAGLMAGFVDSAGKEVVTRGSLYVEWQVDGTVSKIKNLRLVFDDADVTSGTVISTLYNGFAGAPGGGSMRDQTATALEGLGLLGNSMQAGSSLGVKDLSRLSTKDDHQSWDHNHMVRINAQLEGYPGTYSYWVRSPVAHSNNPTAAVPDYCFTSAANLPQLNEGGTWYPGSGGTL